MELNKKTNFFAVVCRNRSEWNDLMDKLHAEGYTWPLDKPMVTEGGFYPQSYHYKTGQVLYIRGSKVQYSSLSSALSPKSPDCPLIEATFLLGHKTIPSEPQLPEL